MTDNPKPFTKEADRQDYEAVLHDHPAVLNGALTLEDACLGAMAGAQSAVMCGSRGFKHAKRCEQCIAAARFVVDVARGSRYTENPDG